MSARSDLLPRSGRAARLWFGLGMALLTATTGCKPDTCKDPAVTLTQAQRCTTCKPVDTELLARLNPTELPWPVRRSIEDCATAIHKRDPRNFVTKQALRECTGHDPSLDSDTKVAVAELINKSNLMEQPDLDHFHALCLASAPAPSPMVPTGAPPASLTPPPAAPAMVDPLAPQPGPMGAPAAAPAPQPWNPAPAAPAPAVAPAPQPWNATPAPAPTGPAADPLLQ